MFVPIQARRASAAGRRAQAKQKPAVVVAVVTAVVGVAVSGMVSSLLHARTPVGGAAVVVGLTVGLGAAAAGLVLARLIGRQGRA